MNKTIGLIAAPTTGFNIDGSISLDAVKPYAEHLHRQGLAGIFVNGTTGEGVSLTQNEREKLASEWRRVLPTGMKLFVHAGHNSQMEAIRLAQHAQDIRADAVAVMAPGFFKPDGIDGLIEWCAPIAAAARKLPFYFYHMPAMNGVHLNITGFLRAAGESIPNLAGIKFTFEAMGDYQDALRLENGRYDLLWGRDEMLLGALALGAVGGVGSTYNIINPLYLQLIQAFKDGNLILARDLQASATAIINILAASGNFFSALKAVLQSQGVPLTPMTRSPLRLLSNEKANEVCRKVKMIITETEMTDKQETVTCSRA
ncbi:MAG: dihydrodipicolinate synthase family protein [Planctomycetes bacterium]|nr:dihydrodipicolinate synthase family protein [Planctomycetota bacterium]